MDTTRLLKGAAGLCIGLSVSLLSGCATLPQTVAMHPMPVVYQPPRVQAGYWSAPYIRGPLPQRFAPYRCHHC